MRPAGARPREAPMALRFLPSQSPVHTDASDCVVIGAFSDKTFSPSGTALDAAAGGRLKALAERGDFDALIALGCIVRGETYHFELVANESGAGVSRVGLDHGIPIANAILTTENMAQAVARQTDKGRDAARVAIEMALLLERMR